MWYLSVLIFSSFTYVCGQLEAQCDIYPNSGVWDNALEGRVTFAQHLNKTSGKVFVKVGVTLSGLLGNSRGHGFHVHEKGALGNNCSDAGSHYNPHNTSHGAPNDTNRHVGDLGNLYPDNKGVVRTSFLDHVIKLQSIIGRAVVIHEKADDLGRGGDADSRVNGNAGRRLGCCVIKPAPSTTGVFLHSTTSSRPPVHHPSNDTVSQTGGYQCFVCSSSTFKYCGDWLHDGLAVDTVHCNHGCMVKARRWSGTLYVERGCYEPGMDDVTPCHRMTSRCNNWGAYRMSSATHCAWQSLHNLAALAGMAVIIMYK